MQSIALPQKPKFSLLDERTGKFEIEGCYPGYGTTLGNALRRVLLSSLSGSAITAVKIKGVTHEFSTIPNVKEDVIQIILNLKKVRFRSYSDEPVKVSLKAKGEKVITADMIECPTGVEVVTGDATIATITSAKGELEIELEIGNGIGYVPVDQQERSDKEIGVIAVDAIYTPIKRVNYDVANMRVGKKTDYERITIEIVTDGSIHPEEAFAKAVDILVDQFSVFKSLESKKEEVSLGDSEGEKAVTKEIKADVAEEISRVSELKGLSTRTANVLEENKIEKIKELSSMTEVEVSGLDGMGAKGIKEIKKALGELGINLKQ